MVQVTIDEEKLEEHIKKVIADKLKSYDADLVFWDTAELKRRTCMSWNTIQSTFFHDPAFPKRKVGSKWYFPGEATKVFLLQWLDEKG